MKERLPEPVVDVRSAYPDVWRAFNDLGAACHDAGPLGERERRLVKVALAAGAGLEGGMHSAVRLALDAGVTAEEIRHVVLLGTTTLGWPATVRNWTWIHDVLGEPSGDTGG